MTEATTETTQPAAPAAQPPARKPSIEDRIAAALAPAEPAPEEAPAPAPEQAAQTPPEPAEQERAEDEAPAERLTGDDDAVEIEVETLAQLAEHIGADVADLYGLRVPVTGPDGTRQEVTLSEWKDSFQGSASLKKEQAELEQMRSAAAAERQQVQSAWSQRMDQATKLLETAERQLKADFESIDWREHEANDPAQAALDRQKLKERQAEIEAAKADVERQRQQAQQEWSRDQAERLDAIRAKEEKALLEAVPEWANAETRKAEMPAVVEHLAKVGYTQQEIQMINDAGDHRFILMARDAARYRAAVGKADIAKKKVLRLGNKVLKPGTKPGRQEQQQDQVRAVLNRHKKVGTIDSAADAIAARLGRR